MGLNERIGHKKANFVRLGLKAGAVLGAVAGINLGKKAGETHFEEYKSKEQQKQREENVATFAGVAQSTKGLAQPVSQSGEEIIKRTRGGVFGGGLVPPAPPPPPSKPALIGKVVGVAVGQASLKEELVSAGKDYYERSLSRDEADKKFREAQRQRSQSASTTAEGGVGSTEASTKDLLRIGKRKAVKKIKFWR
tara:strand:- start:725 stop:1306 length:582 start_codon:yes stop_codon:yes gene_type:complete